jgi:tetratricopeptide (TPR) repeat protein
MAPRAARLAAVVATLVCAAASLAQTPETPVPLPAFPSITSGLADPVAELIKLAGMQIQIKKYDEAIATLQSVFAKLASPHDKATIWNRMANAYQLKGDFGGSLRAQQQALELWPDNPVLLTDMALLDQVQGDDDNARKYYEKAIAIDPNNPLALNNLAFLMTETDGDLDLALSYARAAESKLPGFVEVHDTIGSIDLRKNLTSEAINEFRLAIIGSPDNPVYQYHYALALYQQGDLVNALQRARYASEKSPSADVSRKVLNLIGNLIPQVDALPHPSASAPPQRTQAAPQPQRTH